MKGASSSNTLVEFTLPAIPEYILVAKRAAAALCGIEGFSRSCTEEFSIALAQACEAAIENANERFGEGRGLLRLRFNKVKSGLELEITTEYRPRGIRHRRKEEEVIENFIPDPLGSLSMDMIRCFVDDLNYRFDMASGFYRMRLVKYRFS